jgi:hypothetical protein
MAAARRKEKTSRKVAKRKCKADRKAPKATRFKETRKES